METLEARLALGPLATLDALCAAAARESAASAGSSAGGGGDLSAAAAAAREQLGALLGQLQAAREGIRETFRREAYGVAHPRERALSPGNEDDIHLAPAPGCSRSPAGGRPGDQHKSPEMRRPPHQDAGSLPDELDEAYSTVAAARCCVENFLARFGSDIDLIDSAADVGLSGQSGRLGPLEIVSMQSGPAGRGLGPEEMIQLFEDFCQHRCLFLEYEALLASRPVVTANSS